MISCSSLKSSLLVADLIERCGCCSKSGSGVTSLVFLFVLTLAMTLRTFFEEMLAGELMVLLTAWENLEREPDPGVGSEIVLNGRPEDPGVCQ